MSKTAAAKILLERDRLTARYRELQAEMKSVREQLAQLTLVGGYRPQAILRMCKCGAGPFSTRELRLHRCGGES
jgi:hypothetical protein